MQEFTFIIKDKNGLHARPAGAISSVSKSYVSSVTIKCGEKVADGKRLLSVMSLGAKCGASLHFEIEGKDEELTKDALYSVCEEKLGTNDK
ncbi:MAG: HPr family phosphocarrier protein [Clostridia bacterium]|nr:HPr family phosphocarrier protein [Clostridia bacterium]